jgi:hypothetical protein
VKYQVYVTQRPGGYFPIANIASDEFNTSLLRRNQPSRRTVAMGLRFKIVQYTDSPTTADKKICEMRAN